MITIWSPLYPQGVKISVRNPSNATSSNEPVIAPWKDLSKKLPHQTNAHILLSDEKGKPCEFQIDDLDLDGTPDELVFVADFTPNQTRSFTLSLTAKQIEGEEKPFRTDAQNWKRVKGVLQAVDDDDLAGNARDRTAYRFDGVGWESEIVGYRLYLDGRNAVDIQGKRKPGLYWKWIGESGVDYQLDADWGMDVLHVGPSLGVGGIGFWVGDSVLKPLALDHQRCRVIARGPVRAVARVEYTGWDLGGEKVDVTSLFTICAGDRVCEHRVTLTKGTSPRTLVTGIVKHDSTEVNWSPKEGCLFTIGRQSRANDVLMMALTVRPSSVIRKSEDVSNELLLLKLAEDKPLSILISSYWQGENGKIWSNAETREFLKAIGRRVNEPMKVKTH